MPAWYEHPHTVGEAEIDAQGHANNVVFVAWMQEAALAHSAALGWPAERYRRLGQGWVVRSHAITYRRPALPGEDVVVRTWVDSMRRSSSVRKFVIVRRGDAAVLAEAQTNWAFVDYASGRLARVPDELVADFRRLTPLESAADGGMSE